MFFFFSHMSVGVYVCAYVLCVSHNLSQSIHAIQLKQRKNEHTHTLTNLLPKSMHAYLAAVRELEEEVQNAVGDAQSEGVLQVHLVALQHLLGVLGAPPEQHPRQVVLDHRDRRVRNVALLLRQRRIDVLLELAGQLADDQRAVGDLDAVQLDERQHALLRAQLHLVVDVLGASGRTHTFHITICCKSAPAVGRTRAVDLLEQTSSCRTKHSAGQDTYTLTHKKKRLIAHLKTLNDQFINRHTHRRAMRSCI